jgi:hypothetical protein
MLTALGANSQLGNTVYETMNMNQLFVELMIAKDMWKICRQIID